MARRHYCTGDDCGFCEAEIGRAEDRRYYPDPFDAPDNWEP